MSEWLEGWRAGFLAAYYLFRDKPGWEEMRDEYLAVREKASS